MKKMLIVLIIVASFFTFQTAFIKYDRYITNNFFKFSPDHSFFEVAISGELNADEIKRFQENLLLLLDDYGLYCYQNLYMDREYTEYIVWAYTKDPYYLSNIYFTKGKLTSIHPGDYFYSNDGDRKGVIFNPIRNKNYKIYHLNDFSSEHKSIFIPYYLVTYAEDAEKVYRNFANDLAELYPNLIFDSSMLNFHGGWGGQTVDYSDFIFAILTGMMVIIGLNITIIKQTKKIQMLKLEGYENWQIYRKYVLSYIGLILLAAVITNIVMYLFYIETSAENAKQFLSFLIAPNLIFIASLFAFSIVSFTTVLLIDVNLAVKGKSSLMKQKTLNYVMKILLIVFTTGTVLNVADYLGQYYTTVTTEQQYLSRIEHLYHASFIIPQYTAAAMSGDFGIDGAQLRNDYLRRENNLFELMFIEQKTVGGKEFVVFKATQNYARQYILQIQSNEIEDGSYILIPENLSHLREQIHKALDYVEYRGFGSLGIL